MEVVGKSLLAMALTVLAVPIVPWAAEVILVDDGDTVICGQTHYCCPCGCRKMVRSAEVVAHYDVMEGVIALAELRCQEAEQLAAGGGAAAARVHIEQAEACLESAQALLNSVPVPSTHCCLELPERDLDLCEAWERTRAALGRTRAEL